LKYFTITFQGEISEAAENIINRDFHSEKPNEKVLTDITEFSIPATNADLVNSMLDDYHSKLKEDEKPIVHSDRGCHYRWPGWINRMNKYGYTRSMSKKGCSPDNSACEGFFGRMKNEMFYGRNFVGVTIETFVEIINDYIIWYNTKRIKASLGYLSPMEYRQSLGLI
jgi:putative transposase